MKIVILGSGVIGVTTAHYLAASGHEVTVVDRQPGPALETSFANAGEVSPGYSAPWAAPGIPLKALKWLFMKHRPLVIWPRLDPAMWAWGVRLGDRIRVGGTAELAGYNSQLREARRDTLNHVVTDLFPRGGDVGAAQFWTCLRPMTPDGTPILGASPMANLFLSTGHGTLGWTMAAGTGRVMADIISGRPADTDLEGLTLSRYRRGPAQPVSTTQGVHA